MPNANQTNRERINSIPIIHTRGSYYEVGFNVGKTFRGLIEDFLTSSARFHDILLPAYNTKLGKKAYGETLECLRVNFPNYVRELQGTADGARVPFLHLMLLHMDDIIPKACGVPPTGCNGCSTIYCNYEHQVILGHNEDGLPEGLNHLYIVCAHIEENTPQGRWKTKEENFTALCCAGHLPGFCMSYNHHGLVFSVNAIFPKVVLSGKTPRHFLARALLSAKTMEEAQLILKDRTTGSADGFSINMTFTSEEGDHLFHNAEVGPAVDVDESPMSFLTIRSGEYFVHANTFQRLDIAEDIEIEGPSSDHRLQRSRHFHPIDSRDSILRVLTNTEDTDYPFFREATSPKDPIITTATGLFDILARTWTIWVKNPMESEPVVSMPMVFKWTSKSSSKLQEIEQVSS